MITMKNPKQLPYAVMCAIAGLILTVSGCGDKRTDAGTTAATATPAADNTAKNARDRDDTTLTAGDQGNTPADREITQKIRRALTSDASYSTTAKNVKIITVNGKVSLRGPVKTATEKSGIVGIAKMVAGEGNVDDQLEVKA
jgi:osmotically-inducible protein OsmY